MSVDGGASRHLELRTAALVARLLDLVDTAVSTAVLDPLEVAGRAPFLSSVRASQGALAGDDLSGPSADWLAARAAAVAADASRPPPLHRLAAAYGDDVAADVLVAAALVERDVRFGPLFALLQAPTDSVRPCSGLLAALTRRPPGDVVRLVEALADDGLVDVEGTGELRAERPIRIPDVVLDVLEGRPPGTLAEPPPAPLIGPPELHTLVTRATAMIDEGELDVVIVRGTAGSGRRTVLRTIASGLGRPLLVAEPGDRHAPAVAMLTGALLAWHVSPGLGQLSGLPPSPRAGAVGVLTGRRGAIAAAPGSRTAVIDLATPGAEHRRQFWLATGAPASEEVIDTLSRRYALSGGAITAIAAQATVRARLDGRESIDVDDARQAAQDRGRQQLEALAELLAPIPPTRQPVLSGETATAFETLVMRSRHREQLGPSIGGAAASGIGRGVKAVLSGPSGTGKTLTARALGAILHLDVYRANLAALVDKYIGETERRFDDLLSRAEELDVVLLVDEGDAVLTQRTEVHSSNDRYANLETDFFLQRLESYEGIVLITTNAPHLIDSAFQRRLDVTVAFGPPGPAERAAIWQQHLPARHAVTDGTLAAIAETCRLTGGQIRNAMLHAALLALEDGRPVDDGALRRAVEREFALSGQTFPLATRSMGPSPFELAVNATAFLGHAGRARPLARWRSLPRTGETAGP